MQLKSCVLLLLLCLGVVSSVHSQTFDPYARVSDPRAICRLDGPDTLPVRIFSGLAYTNERDPNDNFFVIAKGTGSGILTHLWLMYYQLPYDSAVTVKIWIDDSLVISSYLYKLFNTPHGALRAPFDSLASGGLDCDVQMGYKRNFKISYLPDPTVCCLFWGIEYRPIVDSSLIESFSLQPSNWYDQKQRIAEKAYHNGGSPWTDRDTTTISYSGETVLPLSTKLLADISGHGMIESIRFQLDTSEFMSLKTARLRMFWDNSPYASVDVPLLDFFGCAVGFRNVNALQIRSTESGYLISYLPLPFYHSARIEVKNTSSRNITLKSEIVYSKETTDRYNQGYFYTQFYQSSPARWHIYHPVARMLGRGKFFGIQMTLPDDPLPYYMEGDPHIDVDSNINNRIRYPGSEDYFTGGWFYSDSVFSLPFAGGTKLYTNNYRFHYLDAYDFEKSFHFDFEHGARNDFHTTYRTVAYMYRRWTPFWVDRDTIHPNEFWKISGSGYTQGESIAGVLGKQTLFETKADKDGNFSEIVTIPSNRTPGTYILAVNDYARPEPIVLLDKPSVVFLNDSVPHLFRYKDSLILFGTGFKPGEEISVFFDTTEAEYFKGDRHVGEQYEWMFPVRLPWLKDGAYHITARGSLGSVAISDTVLFSTRQLNYECEDIAPIVAEAYTEASNLGYNRQDNWSNQYTRLFYPWEPFKRMELVFNVPVSDTFHIGLYNTIGQRYGMYDISLDGILLTHFNGFFDTAYSLPFRSKEGDGGIHFLEKGEHRLGYYCTGADPKGREFLLGADNFILSPTTPFHSIKYSSDTSVHVTPTIFSSNQRLSISPNPLHQNDVHIHIELDSTFRLHSDVLVIELYDILGRKVASVVNGTIGVRSLDLTQDCSKLAAGKYFCRMRVISPTNTTEQTVSFVIDR